MLSELDLDLIDAGRFFCEQIKSALLISITLLKSRLVYSLWKFLKRKNRENKEVTFMHRTALTATKESCVISVFGGSKLRGL